MSFRARAFPRGNARRAVRGVELTWPKSKRNLHSGQRKSSVPRNSEGETGPPSGSQNVSDVWRSEHAVERHWGTLSWSSAALRYREGEEKRGEEVATARRSTDGWHWFVHRRKRAPSDRKREEERGTHSFEG